MPQEKYVKPGEIEAKWQQYWEEHKTFKVEIDKNKPKSYVLKCSRIPPVTCIWVTYVTIPSATLSHVSVL